MSRMGLRVISANVSERKEDSLSTVRWVIGVFCMDG